MTTSLIKTGQTESYLVSMVHDILTSSSGDHQKIQDLTLLMENTNEYTREHHRIQHLLTTSDHQRYHGIPGFHSIAPISRGGFGRVYQATHGVDGHTYAIKTIPIKLYRNGQVKPLNITNDRYKEILKAYNMKIKDEKNI